MPLMQAAPKLMFLSVEPLALQNACYRHYLWSLQNAVQDLAERLL